MTSPTYPDLQRKKILITGATQGIGRACCLELAAQGAHVIVNYRQGRQERAHQLVSQLKASGASDVHTVEFDVTHSQQMKQNLDALVANIGPIEGLVNNAGIVQNTLLIRMKEEDLGRILDTNLKAAITLTGQLTRGLLRQRGGSVVNISSIVGLMGNPAQTAYGASKAGLLGFTKSYAKEMGPKSIRCNAICPGYIETNMTNTLDQKVQAQYKTAIPLGRFGRPQEVAGLVCFLLSEASAYITGEIIKIDGGLYT